MFRKYKRINDDAAALVVLIENSHYNDKSGYYAGCLVLTQAYRNYEISLYSRCDYCNTKFFHSLENMYGKCGLILILLFPTKRL